MTDNKQRLAPRAPEDWDDRTRQILGGTLEPAAEREADAAGEGGTPPSGGGSLNILRTIAHHPRLLEPFLGFAATLATQGVLTRRDAELLALRTAWNCRSPFEWAHHAVYGEAAGLGADEIAGLARPIDARDWSDPDRALLEAADALHARQDVSDELWARLAERFDAAQLVEIPFVVGQYAMLSMVANATGVPVEPGLPELPGAEGR